MAVSSIRSVAVFLGSAEPEDSAFSRAAADLAKYLASHDMTLVFGGSCRGMMKTLADAMLRHNGRTVGVFTRCLPPGLVRNDLGESVFTDTLAERKAEMLRRADAVVALPGSLGTFDELFTALALRKIGELACPVGVLNVNGFFDPLFSLLRNSVENGFSSPRTALLTEGKTPGELFEKFRAAAENRPLQGQKIRQKI